MAASWSNVAKDEDRRLFLRRMDEVEPTPIDGTVGAQRPFFSPDDRWLGFFAQGKLRMVPVTGGAARVLADAPAALGASWGPSGAIVFAGESQAGLRRVEVEGGSVEELTTPDMAGVSHRWPEFLPGGDAVLYTLWRGPLGTMRGSRCSISPPAPAPSSSRGAARPVSSPRESSSTIGRTN